MFAIHGDLYPLERGNITGYYGSSSDVFPKPSQHELGQTSIPTACKLQKRSSPTQKGKEKLRVQKEKKSSEDFKVENCEEKNQEINSQSSPS